MSYQMPPAPEKDEDKATIASAIQEITEKAQLLVKDEIELAKAEVEVKVKALGKGAAISAAAGVFVLGVLRTCLLDDIALVELCFELLCGRFIV